jgi:thiosulfate dehydrogenase (quinone) large subunit
MLKVEKFLPLRPLAGTLDSNEYATRLIFPPMSKQSAGVSQFLFHSTSSSWLWLIVRVYIGWQWLHAGYEKAINPAWTGDQTGTAITGFFNNALTKTGGLHPDVSMGYAWFLQNVALPNANFFSYVITFGEIAVGLALILGLFTGMAAFFGATMNFNFMFAGSVSLNPYWLLCEIFLMLAWRVAGHIGLDKYVLPYWHRLRR